MRFKRAVVFCACIVGMVAVSRADDDSPATDSFAAPDDFARRESLVRDTLQSIEAAVIARDERQFFSLLAPDVRLQVIDYDAEFPDGTPIKFRREKPLWELIDSRALSVISTEASSDLVSVYVLPEGEIWEVYVRWNGPHLKSSGLWYFVRAQEKLLVRDCREIPSPPDFKHFSVKSRETMQPKKAAQPGATDNPGDAQ